MWLCFASISHQRIISVAHFLPEKKRNITIIMKIIIVSKNISAVMGTWFLANHMFAK